MPTCSEKARDAERELFQRHKLLAWVQSLSPAPNGYNIDPEGSIRHEIVVWVQQQREQVKTLHHQLTLFPEPRQLDLWQIGTEEEPL